MSRTSLLSRLTGPKGAAASSGITTAEIARRLDQARASVNKLAQECRSLALDAEGGDGDASGKLTQAEQALQAAQTRAGRLQDALEAARSRDAEREAAAKAAIRASRLAACRKHAELRLAGAEEITRGFEIAIAGLKALERHTAGMIAASDTLPEGSVEFAFDQEFRRHTHLHSGSVQLWSGKPLCDAIAEANAFVLQREAAK